MYICLLLAVGAGPFGPFATMLSLPHCIAAGKISPFGASPLNRIWMYTLNTYEYIVYIHVNHDSESIFKTTWLHTEYILKTCILYIMNLNTSCRSWSRSQLIRNDGRMDQNHEAKLWIHGDSLGIHRNFSMKNRYFFLDLPPLTSEDVVSEGPGWTWLVSTTRSPGDVCNSWAPSAIGTYFLPLVFVCFIYRHTTFFGDSLWFVIFVALPSKKKRNLFCWPLRSPEAS